MAMITEIPLNKGSSISVTTVLRGADKKPLNLTGLDYTVDIYDAAAPLATVLTVTVLDEANGRFRITSPWHDAFAEKTTSLQFRYRLRIGETVNTSRLLTFVVR